MNKVLICVLSYNRQPYTKQCLEALFNYTSEPFDLVVVDNGSAAPSLELLKNFEDKKYGNGSTSRVVYNGTNLGVSKALNIGMRLRQPGQHYMKLDNDMVLPNDYESWLTEMIDITENSRRDIDNVKLVALSPFNYNRPMSEHFPRRFLDLTNGHRYEIEDPMPYACLGAGKFVHSDVIDRIGGYNEKFGLYGFEDTDYGNRAIRVGFKNVYHAKVQAKHIDAENLPESAELRALKTNALRHNGILAGNARIEYAHDGGKVRIPL